MTTRARIRRVEKKLHAHEPVRYDIRVVCTTDEEGLTYEGKKISREEYHSLVREGRIIVVGWSEGEIP